MSNWVLALDTSAGTCVAILHNGQVAAEVVIANNMKHAETVGIAIQQVLVEAGIKPAQITAVVIGRGPAPYTGLRVGIAAAAMFAEAIAVPAFGVVSLDAIALAALRANPLEDNRPLLVTADARRSEVYWALYSGLSANGAPIRIEGPSVAKPADLAEQLAARGILHHTTEATLTAGNLGLVAEAHLLDGIRDSELSPLYLRAPDAVLPKANLPYGKRVSAS